MKLRLVITFCLCLESIRVFSAGVPIKTPGQTYDWGNTNQIPGRDAAMAVMTNAIQVSSKASNWELGLKSDGKLWAWGINTLGQTNVPPDGDYKYSAAGWDCGAGIRSNGLVVVWGNTNSWTLFPASPITDGKEVALGDGHCAVLHSNGSVTVDFGWRTSVRSVPAKAATNVAHLESTWYAVVCLTSNGNVFSWGEASEPGSYLAGPSALYTNGIASLACGLFELCSIDSNAVLRCWGTTNTYGELNVPVGLSNCTMVAGGGYHTIATDNTGHIWAWGRNDVGQCNASNPPNAAFVWAGYFNGGAISNAFVTVNSINISGALAMSNKVILLNQ